MMKWMKLKVAAGVVAGGMLAGGMMGSVRGAEATTRPAESALEQAKKALAADLEVLHQKGEPVRVEDLARPAVADGENAALDLREAVKCVDEKTLRAYDDLEGPLAKPLSAEQAAVIRALVKADAPALKLVGSAMAKGKVDWKTPYTTPALDILLPDLAGMRQLANVLGPAARLAHDGGDDVAALEHVREMLFVSRAAGEQPFLVSHLVETGIVAMACDVCREISPTVQVGKEKAMREQLGRTIGELMDESGPRGHMRRAMQGERVSEVDTAMALASGKLTVQRLGEMTGKASDLERLGLQEEEVVLMALGDARIMAGEMTKVVEASSAADLPTARKGIAAGPDARKMEPRKHPLMVMMAPSWRQKAFESHYRGLVERRLAATALAIRWYAADHEGKLPKALQDLTPAYLPVVPMDPMRVGEPLIYAPDNGVVYSVGVDGEDDGGDAGKGQVRGKDIVMPLR